MSAIGYIGNRSCMVSQGGRCEGCPRKLVTSQIRPNDDGRQTASMVVQHLGLDKKVLSKLDLGPIHRELEADCLGITRQEGASNVLLARVSFNCEITEAAQKIRDYLSFNLKIPGDEDGVLTSDKMQEVWKGREAFFKSIGHFYALGRTIANPKGATHGPQPNYSRKDPTHDQFILHSEQIVVSYLASPESALMIKNYLKALIRGKYPGSTSAKVYNMGLHLHSKKTCCSACEYVLVGLMNSWDPVLGFLPKFVQACEQEGDTLSLRVPQIPELPGSFSILTTVTANEPDQTHRLAQERVYRRKDVALDSVPIDVIEVAAPLTARTIFTCVVNPHVPRSPLLHREIEGTVVISGSKKTKGSASTIKATQEESAAALEQQIGGVDRLFSSFKKIRLKFVGKLRS